MSVHSEKQAQVKSLLFNKAFTKVLVEFFNYSNVFSVKNTVKLSENTRMNKHAIKQEEDQQSPFGLIFNLKPIKLKTLKTYMKTNLVNGFI